MDQLTYSIPLQENELSSFTYFPLLPLEIQKQIWELANSSRGAFTVTITRADSCINEMEHLGEYLVDTLGASYEIPPLAHTCQISRQTCFTRYRYHLEDR